MIKNTKSSHFSARFLNENMELKITIPIQFAVFHDDLKIKMENDLIKHLKENPDNLINYLNKLFKNNRKYKIEIISTNDDN